MDLVGLVKRTVDRMFHPEGRARVMGAFDDHESTLQAIRKLRDGGFDRLIVHSPAPSHEIEEATGKGLSIVRWFTLTGAILGGTGGFALASWTSMQWNLITSGKPIISVPPFLIITFECTILLGAIFTLIGFLHSARIPQPGLSELYRERFGDDQFGIGIVCDDAELDRAEQALVGAGAREVSRAKA